MVIERKKGFYRVVVISTAVLILFLGYTCYRLNKERDALTLSLKQEQNRYKALQVKYAEQKTRMATMRRSKLALEGNLRQAQKELKTVQEEKDALAEELAGLEEKYDQKVATLKAHIEKYKENMEKLVENRDAYKAELAETVAVVKERNEMIHELTAEKEDLSLKLQETKATLKRCVKHNARLSVLSEELVTAYENKGVGDSLLHAEPLTQLERVEVEKLIQEYRDRIDDNNLELINPQR